MSMSTPDIHSHLHLERHEHLLRGGCAAVHRSGSQTRQAYGTTADIARNPARMQRSGSCKGAPASADGIRAAQAYDPRRQGAFAGNRREKRSPPSDGGDTRRGIVGCETPVKRQAVEPDAEVFMQQWECFESVRRSYRSTLQEDIQTWFRTLRL